jgi:hypothetical protein
VAECGWAAVAVGSQLGSQLGYPHHHTNPAGTQSSGGGAATTEGRSPWPGLRVADGTRTAGALGSSPC